MFSGNQGGSKAEGQGGAGSGDLIGGAMNAYKMFSGGKGGSSASSSGGGSGGGGNIFDTIGMSFIDLNDRCIFFQ